MASGGRGGAEIDIGRVLGGAFGEFRNNARPFAAAALLLAGLPAFLLYYGMLQAGIDIEEGLGTAFALMMLPELTVGTLLQAALIHSTVGGFNGQPPPFSSSLLLGAKRLLPIAAAVILFYVAIGIGLLLLVIPGLIFLTISAVMVPAMVEERAGILSCFARSRELTKGSRWRVFGVLLVSFLIDIAVSTTLEFAASLAGKSLAAAPARRRWKALLPQSCSPRSQDRST